MWFRAKGSFTGTCIVMELLRIHLTRPWSNPSAGHTKGLIVHPPNSSGWKVQAGANSMENCFTFPTDKAGWRWFLMKISTDNYREGWSVYLSPISPPESCVAVFTPKTNISTCAGCQPGRPLNLVPAGSIDCGERVSPCTCLYRCGP